MQKYVRLYTLPQASDTSIVRVTWDEIGHRYGKAIMKNGRVSAFTYPMTMEETAVFTHMVEEGLTAHNEVSSIYLLVNEPDMGECAK